MLLRGSDGLTPRENAEQDDIDEQELKRLYYERLSDWSEPGAVKVYRDGKLVELPAEPDQLELLKGDPSEIDPEDSQADGRT